MTPAPPSAELTDTECDRIFSARAAKIARGEEPGADGVERDRALIRAGFAARPPSVPRSPPREDRAIDLLYRCYEGWRCGEDVVDPMRAAKAYLDEAMYDTAHAPTPVRSLTDAEIDREIDAAVAGMEPVHEPIYGFAEIDRAIARHFYALGAAHD